MGPQENFKDVVTYRVKLLTLLHKNYIKTICIVCIELMMCRIIMKQILIPPQVNCQCLGGEKALKYRIAT